MVVRFWLDVPGMEKRKHMAERICRVADNWTKSEQIRRAREIVEASGADTRTHFFTASDSTTFREQSELWLESMADPNRRGGKASPSTLETVEGALRKWLIPHVGDLLLSDCDNATAKTLIQVMRKGGLADKTINNYFHVFSSVVASALSEEGVMLHPRDWDKESIKMFIGLPLVDTSRMRRPALSADALSALIATESKAQLRTLYILLAATGLRAGEALGLRIEDIREFHIEIRQKAWRNQIHDFLKTKNGQRNVYVCSEVMSLLREFVGKRPTGLVFQTKGEQPLSQSNIIKRNWHPALRKLEVPDVGGFHMLRRFRISHLRKMRVPESLIRAWLGHSNKSVTDDYDKSARDAEWNREVAEKVGPGFSIVRNVRNFSGEKGTEIPSEVVAA
jgi:integrase